MKILQYIKPEIKIVELESDGYIATSLYTDEDPYKDGGKTDVDEFIDPLGGIVPLPGIKIGNLP